MIFDHEKLKVYQKTLEFIDWSNSLIVNNVRKSSVVDQLDRASTSVPLNIAEGNGKYSSKDRCRYFDSARGSALECAACLDILKRKNLIEEKEQLKGKTILYEIVSMLVGLIKSNSDRVYESEIDYKANS